MMKFTAFVITAAVALLSSPSYNNIIVSAQETTVTSVSGVCPAGSSASGDTCDAIRGTNDAKWPSCCNGSGEYCRCGGDGMVCGADPSEGNNCASTVPGVNVSKENDDGDEASIVVVTTSGGGGNNNNNAAAIALSIVAAASIGGVVVDLI